MPDREKNKQDLYDVIMKVNMFIYTWKVYSKEQIPRGNFDISQILELIEGHFHMVFGNKTINQRMNPFQYRVEINQNVNLAIACYAERSIFKLLGFGSQSLL